MIHTASLKKHIRFAIQHYGTRTQGEEYRFDQVADHLVELFIQAMAYSQAMDEVRKHYPDMPTTISLAFE